METHRSCRIAFVESDPAIAAPILTTLRGAGHACRRFATGASALREIDADRFDLLLVERIVPDMPPTTLMTGIRARLGFALPVIALAAAGDADGIVATLDDGADECLARPVPPLLLLAQINAALRRAAPSGRRIEASVGHLGFQPEGSRVCVGDTPVILTAKEYALALLLCRNLGTPLSREHILATIWGDDVAPLTRTLDVHVSRLRTKLALRPERGFRLSALYGRGYRLDHPVQSTTPPAEAVSQRRSASPSARPAAAHQPAGR